MSDNYSVHHFQRGPGGTVEGGVTIQVPDDGGGTPATASYFDYTVNFREPAGTLDYNSLNETDPIIDIDINSRTIRMLAKLSYIEIVNNKELYNDTFIDTDNMHNKTNATLHNGDTNFTDDVLINGYVKDVTDLITAIRDACCHIDSFKRNFDENGNTGSHNIIYGKGIALNIDGLVLGSDYEDEIAYIYGKNRIYVRRHIIRAFEEAKLKLNEFLK